MRNPDIIPVRRRGPLRVFPQPIKPRVLPREHPERPMPARKVI